MARPRKHGTAHLPRYLHEKHGAVYYVRDGKWTRLADNVPDATVALGKMQGGKVGEAVAAAVNGTMARSELMADLVTRALPFMLAGKKAGTARTYTTHAESLIAALGSLTVAAFKVTNVWAIQEKLIKQPSKFNGMLNMLRQVIVWAKKRDIEVASITEVKSLVGNQRDHYIDDVEYAAIYAKADELIQVIMELCYRTGQRIGDVLAITESQLTDEGVYFKQGKTDAKLIVGWTDELRAAVARARALSAKRSRDDKVVSLSRLLLCGRGGKPLVARTVNNRWHAALTASGIKDTDIHLHDVRAKTASDVDVTHGTTAAQAVMGHASPAMTRRYIRHRRAKVVQGPTAARKA